MIRFDHVYKEFPRSGLALKNVTFHVRKGEFVFITGPSGAGKSTILKMIHMSERPTQGAVRVTEFSSQSIRRREIPLLRRRVGMVFQDFRLLRNRTAAENIAFALEVTGTKRAQIYPKVQRLLADVGLAAKAEAHPDELSGGEQQRVAIARALANDPVILLADEPTGNLDERAAKGTFELIRSIHATGMAVLMATHDLELVRRYPQYRIIELDEGGVVFDSAAADDA